LFEDAMTNNDSSGGAVKDNLPKETTSTATATATEKKKPLK